MITCIAIDDEPLALQQLQRFINRIPDLKLLGAYYSVRQAMQVIDSEKVDLIFLDIEMPDINGIQFAHIIENRHINIIFTTAYPQFAIEGFRLDAVDYLLKPLSMADLTNAVDKVKRRMDAADKSSDQMSQCTIYVKTSGVVKKLLVSEIMYIKGLGEYVQIYMRGEEHPVVTFDSMKRIADELTPFAFMRVHKSYIVNLREIDTASRATVEIAGVQIPVGETFRGNFTAYLKSLPSGK